MPIMGLIFLRHATNRFYEAKAAIDAEKAVGRTPNRPLLEADFRRRRALMLPEVASYDVLLKRPKDGKLGAALTAAMDAVEAASPISPNHSDLEMVSHPFVLAGRSGGRDPYRVSDGSLLPGRVTANS